MATTIAQISPFDIDNDNFVEYEERFSSFLIANRSEVSSKTNTVLGTENPGVPGLGFMM